MQKRRLRCLSYSQNELPLNAWQADFNEVLRGFAFRASAATCQAQIETACETRREISPGALFAALRGDRYRHEVAPVTVSLSPYPYRVRARHALSSWHRATVAQRWRPHR